MGEYLSRKYHYLLMTEKSKELHSAQRQAIGHAVTSEDNVVETDLPDWIQQFIKDTITDPNAIFALAQYERLKLLNQI